MSIAVSFLLVRTVKQDIQENHEDSELEGLRRCIAECFTSKVQAQLLATEMIYRTENWCIHSCRAALIQPFPSEQNHLVGLLLCPTRSALLRQSDFTSTHSQIHETRTMNRYKPLHWYDELRSTADWETFVKHWCRGIIQWHHPQPHPDHRSETGNAKLNVPRIHNL